MPVTGAMLISSSTFSVLSSFGRLCFCRYKHGAWRSEPLTPWLEWQAERRSSLFFLLRSAQAFTAMVSRARGLWNFHARFNTK